MSDLISMDKMPTPYKDLLAKLQPETALGGENFSTSRRISLKQSTFRKVVNGNEVQKLTDNHMDIVIVKAAPISRMFYNKPYVEGENSPPNCWSSDTNTGVPSPDVLASDKEANNCNDCKQNIKGSGQGEGKACRYQQRMAVMLADGLSTREIYSLTIPSASIFKPVDHGMTMQAYARFLQAHKTPAAAVVTEMSLDPDSSYPLLTFKPARPLEEEELAIVVDMQEHPDTIDATTMHITPADSAEAAPTNGGSTPALAFRDKEESNVEEPVPEPTKKVSKKAKAKEEAPPQEALDDLLEEWDDKDEEE